MVMKYDIYSFTHWIFSLMQARNYHLDELAVRTLKKQPDLPEGTLNDLSTIISFCSGPISHVTRFKTISYGGHDIIIKEGALGDGVGAKLWLVARVMCREMSNHADMVCDKDVLEIGAGVGACGLLASKLGARSVVLSDYVDTLLLNLRDVLPLNAGTGHKGSNETEEVEDIYNVSVAKGKDLNLPTRESEWSSGNVAVRFLDWEDSLSSIEHLENNSGKGGPLDGPSSRNVAPSLSESEQFDVIIGTDVLYEWPMTKSLPAVLQQRLRPGGKAFICNAVRDQLMFDALIKNIRDKEGLEVEVASIDTQAEQVKDLFCKGQDYEGGFVWVTVEKT
jgi:predicted nicotinamide N-methyase